MSKSKEHIGLPRGWNWVTISDLISDNGIFCDGDWIESKDQDANGNVRLVQLADIGDGYFRNKSDRHLTSQRAQELNCTYLGKGDILVARMPEPLGRACIFPLNGESKYVTAVDVCIIRPNNKSVDTKYLVYILNAPQSRNAINNLQTGTTRKRISRKNLATILYPLPPLEVQQQIVSKIEELFSELDKCIGQLKTAQRQLKVYRQSVLKWAFEGRFTNENVRDGELPKGWQWTKLNEIGRWTGGGTPSKQRKDFWENGDVLWVSPKDMKVRIIYDTIDKITTKSINESAAKMIEKGSILFVVRSGIIRRTLPIAIAGKDLTTNQDMQSLTLKSVLSEYVFWYCVANEQQIRDSCAKDGTTVDNLEVPKLREYPICICSDDEQLEVVQEIESRLSVTEKLEETIINRLQQAEALKQSTLKKAFEGKLI